MPQLGQHVNAAHLELGRLRILVLVDHVLVERLRHQPVRFGLHPRAAEGGQIEARAAVENQLVVDQMVGRAGRHALLGDGVARRRPQQPLARVHGAHHPRYLVSPLGVVRAGILLHSCIITPAIANLP